MWWHHIVPTGPRGHFQLFCLKAASRCPIPLLTWGIITLPATPFALSSISSGERQNRLCAWQVRWLLLTTAGSWWTCVPDSSYRGWTAGDDMKKLHHLRTVVINVTMYISTHKTYFCMNYLYHIPGLLSKYYYIFQLASRTDYRPW